MSSLEQDRGRADIRIERSQGGRSQRSGGNMPGACLSEKASSLRSPRGDFMVPSDLRKETHFGVRFERFIFCTFNLSPRVEKTFAWKV
jgi:hypothetical protein